jgi:ATPase subunit of ABC transporter with duplicated ATPase domains
MVRQVNLLKIMAGEREASSGDVIIDKGQRLAVFEAGPVCL